MQRRSFAIASALLALPVLTGCVEVPMGSSTGSSAGSSAPGNSAEAIAQQACVRDVRAMTGNFDVSVINSFFSEAGTEVNLRVGPTGTWRCIGYRDGTTAGIQSTTNEGFL